MHTLTIETLPVGLLGSNVYLIYTHSGGEAAIVDPGVRDTTPIRKALTDKSLNLRTLINTHGHFDHIAGNRLLKDPGVVLALHKADRDLLIMGGGSSQFGYQIPLSPEPDRFLEDGDTIRIDDLTLEVIHTPGHTQGSICLYYAKTPVLLTGDTLFAGSVGRTDLPGGNPHQLRQSLMRIGTLPESTMLYPGHGPSTTLAKQIRINPWLQ